MNVKIVNGVVHIWCASTLSIDSAYAKAVEFARRAYGKQSAAVSAAPVSYDAAGNFLLTITL
jgi:hypothetical protein